jgi:hypothetical protein
MKRRLFGLVSYVDMKDRFFLKQKIQINIISE